MKLLLDTHTLLWASLDSSELSQTARDHFLDTTNTLFISPASYWEVAIKISIGKYELTEPVSDYFGREILANDIRILPITLRHADIVSRLEFHHKDPFDRLLIAQSVCENIPILSRDKVFDEYGIDRIR
jgi:PIN domain nuclease of toxin-antitoxin system